MLGLALVGCKPEPEFTTEPEERTKAVLVDPDYKECWDEGGFRAVWLGDWPSVLAYGLPPVAPPYTITHVGAVLLQDGGSCVSSAGYDVQIWVSSEPPDRLEIVDGMPAIDPLVSVTLAEEMVDDITPGGHNNGAFGYVEVELDEPVLVEEPGTLWVAGVHLDHRDEYACLFGCTDGGDTVYTWYGPGTRTTTYDGYLLGPSNREQWLTTVSLPLFKVRVEY